MTDRKQKSWNGNGPAGDSSIEPAIPVDAPRRGERPSPAGQGRTPSLRSGQTIVPREGVAGQALLAVIAIMAFLACLTLGTVFLIRDTAGNWQSDIAREVTVQIRPFDNVDMEESIQNASRLLLSFEGINKVTALDEDASARLLEPFLGAGIRIEELPIPALLTVSIEEGARPDFEMISQQLENEIPGASLDDHKAWVDRLSAMASTTVATGTVVFVLMMAATILTVVFATRGAMAANREVVDVLHFVGADRTYIAREFESHFLRIGMIGSMIGGAGAILLFVALGIWTSTSRASPQAEQVMAMFGTFSIGVWGMLGMVVVAISIAVLTGLTSRFTVMRHVGQLETYGSERRI